MTENNSLIIEKVTLDNFASYQSGEIDLNGGVTVLFGERNGSGKTTFAEAISRVLTGDYLNNVKDVDKIKHGSDQFLITLEGLYRNRNIKIDCRRTKSRKNIQVEYNGNTLSGKEAEEFLANIVTNDEFKRLVYINGSDIDILIQGTPTSRSKVLDRILGIQSLIIVIDALKTRPISNKIAELSMILDQKISEKESLEKMSRELSTKEDIEKSIELSEERMEKIKEDIKEVTERLKPQIVDKKKYIVAKKKLENYTSELNSFKSDLERMETDKRNLEENLEKLNSAIDRLTSKEGGVSEFLQAKDRIVKQCNDNIESLHTQSSEDLPSIIRNTIIDQSLDLCPVCEHEVDIEDVETINSRISSETELRKRRIEGFKKRRDKAFEEKEGLEEYLSRKPSLERRIKDKKSEIVKIESKINEVKEKVDEIELPDWDNELLEELKLKKAMKKGQIKETEKTIYNLKRKLEETEESTQRSDTLEIIINEIETIRKKVRTYNHRLRKVREYRKGLKSILTNVRREMVDQINPLIQQWINIFLGVDDDEVPPISYKLNVIEKTTAKTHTVKYEDVNLRYGVPISFDALSTGQRAMCSLALILAIEDVSFHQIELMIFDEIHTSGIDDQGLAEILNVLVKLVEKTRILFIERRSDVIEYLKNISSDSNIPFDLYKITSNNGISNIIREVE